MSVTDSLYGVDVANEPLAQDEILALPDERDWDNIAGVTGIEVGKLRRDYLDGVKAYIEHPKRITIDDSRIEGEFGPGFEPRGAQDITVVPGVLVVHIEYGFQGGENWKIEVHVTAKVFKKDVGTSSFELSRTQSFIEIHPHALVVKADLKIGVYGERLCFGIEGQACYWAFGWKCQSFNKQEIFCLMK